MILETMNNLSPEDWSNIIDAVAILAAVLFPGAGAYVLALKRGKDELIKAIDAAPVPNGDVLKTASIMGLKRAVGEIARLEASKRDR